MELRRCGAAERRAAEVRSCGGAVPSDAHCHVSDLITLC